MAHPADVEDGPNKLIAMQIQYLQHHQPTEGGKKRTYQACRKPESRISGQKNWK
jgi:hypothetical protein